MQKYTNRYITTRHKDIDGKIVHLFVVELIYGEKDFNIFSEVFEFNRHRNTLPLIKRVEFYVQGMNTPDYLSYRFPFMAVYVNDP